MKSTQRENWFSNPHLLYLQAQQTNFSQSRALLQDCSYCKIACKASLVWAALYYVLALLISSAADAKYAIWECQKRIDYFKDDYYVFSTVEFLIDVSQLI